MKRLCVVWREYTWTDKYKLKAKLQKKKKREKGNGQRMPFYKSGHLSFLFVYLYNNSYSQSVTGRETGTLVPDDQRRWPGVTGKRVSIRKDLP